MLCITVIHFTGTSGKSTFKCMFVYFSWKPWEYFHLFVLNEFSILNVCSKYFCIKQHEPSFFISCNVNFFFNVASDVCINVYF